LLLRVRGEEPTARVSLLRVEEEVVWLGRATDEF